MSTTTPGPTISPQVEAILYFVGLVFVYLASYVPPITAPATERTVFMILGVTIIAIKYELSQNTPTTIPTSLQSTIVLLAVILNVVAGQISADYSTYWWGGLILAIIGAVLAAYTAIGGQAPALRPPPSAPTPAAPAPSTPTKAVQLSEHD